MRVVCVVAFCYYICRVYHPPQPLFVIPWHRSMRIILSRDRSGFFFQINFSPYRKFHFSRKNLNILTIFLYRCESFWVEWARLRLNVIISHDINILKKVFNIPLMKISRSKLNFDKTDFMSFKHFKLYLNYLILIDLHGKFIFSHIISDCRWYFSVKLRNLILYSIGKCFMLLWTAHVAAVHIFFLKFYQIHIFFRKLSAELF